MGRELEEASRPLTVAALNRQAKELLESSFPSVWVTGELSRINRASSGHIYFALKDAEARIDAVIWSTQARALRLPLSEGMEVVVRGQLTIYPPQGRYQIICSTVEPAGEGALRAAFLRLKAKLEAEGLTDPARKRPLPFLPQAVGLVTSARGAALHDLLQVIWRRFPTMRVILCPVRVQGEGAAAEIAEGIRRLNRIEVAEVMVVGRGGGSQEDLWTFNDESLARTIAASRIPVVSAVGHEIDVTISDLVADVRALTPTEAGERVVPVLAELTQLLEGLGLRLATGARRTGREERARLDELARRPGLRLFPGRLQEARQDLDLLEHRGRQVLVHLLAGGRARLEGLGRTLSACSPARWMRERQVAALALGTRLVQATRGGLDRARLALAVTERALDALNPLEVLRRGFSVTRRERDGRWEILRSGEHVQVSDRLRTTFAEGAEVISSVVGRDARSLPGAPNGGALSPPSPGPGTPGRMPDRPMARPPRTKSFRERLEALSQLVEKLEGGELSLEEAISRFEEGKKLHQSLLEELAGFERRLEHLIQEPGGGDHLVPGQEQDPDHGREPAS